MSAAPQPVAFGAIEAERPGDRDRKLAAEAQAARDAGRAEGLAQAASQYESLQAAFAAAEAQRRAQIEGLSRQLEREAVDLALLLAAELVDDHLAYSPQSILRIAQSSLDHVAAAERVTLRVSPADAQLIESFGGLDVPAGMELRVRADDAVQSGGCHVESDAGDVDAGRSERFGRLASALRELRSERHDH